MPTYVSLVNWTEQGVKTFRDTVRRGEDYRGLVEKSGGQVRQLLWTLGEYDVVVVTDFPTTRRPPPCCSRPPPAAASAPRP
jgi:uncharacterized protein with GYD domain